MDQSTNPKAGGGGGPVAEPTTSPRPHAEQLPPHQHEEDSFPILHEGTPPVIDLETWTLKVWGLVGTKTLRWADILALPQVTVKTAFHCVTGWSKLDNQWEGVRTKDLLALLDVKPEARHVMTYGHLSEDPCGYAANVPLEVLMDEEVILAHSHNGQPLTPEHGYPLRLVVPQRYAWKSTKWIRGMEFLAEDRSGYWEARGYHHNADPEAEERYETAEPPKATPHLHGKDDT
jgi:DMSO/TMAO reductase YedYZ molybdopterin-dependent catalytic subunit